MPDRGIKPRMSPEPEMNGAPAACEIEEVPWGAAASSTTKETPASVAASPVVLPGEGMFKAMVT